ncbi:MAG: hypothetical protein B7X86_06140 [Sphingobacteriales bacterium 17-39-43]|uniref:DUF6265 family protein n=1 Tax=Daejeonella sp. TaxID=2805397 RepID=UPI000BC7DEE0|nr:DUF6265 family protein [Daejeonella sp.]OYZ32032.1 MAG: hypothetical protein B7Y24_06955 [Sphingobacteriales bacterium 16-39-50]OZA25336.1 MAG: hypothetical protein B7X86_06140 [Sphingobacteriales bacterium 17-39-43]HQT22580.1 DUF6265 family protein [Daejeonella sp.]HQT58116.1 DUF6265 family protein [Daejeonella sp.]
MKQKLLLFSLFFVLCFESNAQQRTSLSDFDFLKGSWTMNTAKGRIVESWKMSKDSRMYGISFSISNAGDSTLLETIKIYESAGSIYYEPTGNGAGNDSTVSFKLVSAEDGIFVFENKNHDFPQRISYHFQSASNVLAWIEGTVNGKFRKIEFPYSREKLN